MKYLFRLIGRIFGTLRAEYRQITNRYFGSIRRFDGNAKEICAQIVEEVGKGPFYRTSLGHFDFFWMRDFGTACKPLVRLGHQKNVHKTLRWALTHYRRAGIVKTCIDKSGNVFNAPDVRSVDALPWLLHSIHISGYPLNGLERTFLDKELARYRKMFLDPESGHLKSMRFAELRDAVIYDRSAYAVTMVAVLARSAKLLKLEFPYASHRYRRELVNHYWNGRYFNADWKTNAFSAECAVFPFYMGIVDDAEMFARTVKYIKHHKLDRPYPLKYTDQPHAFHHRFWMTWPFMPNYADTAIWSWHGVFYLHVLKRYKHPEYAAARSSFAQMLERHQTWPEMLNPDGSWYEAPVYKGDDGMVWAALFLDLPDKI